MAGEIYFKSGSKSSITTQAPLTPSYKAGTVYFAVDNTDNGFIYFDYNNKRIPMTAIANKDSANNTIVSTYMASVNFDSNSSSLIFKDGNNDAHSTVLLPFLLLTGGNVTGPVNFGDSVTADELTAGSLIVNGVARFNNGLIGNLTGNADTATSATSAVKDSSNNTIIDYYVHSISSANNTLTIKNGAGDSLGTASIINSVSNSWTNGTSSGPTLTTTVNGVSGTAVTIPSASASVSGVVTTGAQTFAGTKTFSSKIVGNLQGNADTATKATKDGADNVIEDTYISDITHTSNTTQDFLSVTYGSGTQVNKFQLTTITIRTWS